MIGPTKPTNFERSSAELEEWLLFCVVVAGKNAHQQAKKLDNFLSLGTGSPFQKIRSMYDFGTLRHNLELVKLGQYNRIEKVFISIMNLCVDELTLSELENIKGIGPKTARFFFLHSKPNQNIAVLDTHILSWMKDQGYKVPKSTPPINKYTQIEQWFLQESKNRNLTPAELDIQIWLERSQKNSYMLEIQEK